ncbi:MAG: N-6 DNA methylase, partial [Armatimonadota bacterium]|nr:N-6 DNA methylase [Armatimonadota bacterium]
VGLGYLAGLIPETNPFLRELFNEFARLGADYEKQVDYDDLGIVDLVEFLNEVPIENILDDFGRQTGGGGEDPVIHFYQTFLHEYDAKARVQRGVYYTPKPVVDFIVRGVDHLLREELNCPLGLADSSKHIVKGKEAFKVTILDPATGTGTFLVSVIELIHDTMVREWKKAGRKEKEWPALWNDYVSQSLLPRLHGFELMMASYTVAHLKIGLKLAEYGYEFKRGERLRVYLTNTLEESQQLALDLPEFLSHEAREAQHIKKETVVTVVLGNPPYAGHSVNNQVEWIVDKVYDYKRGLPDLQKPGQAKWLQDDYVKFIRYAQWRIEQTGLGIVGYISNNGFLDNPTFRGMRKQLMQAFTQLDVLDLHGSTKKRESAPDGTKDENVFDIQQGVCISLFRRLPDTESCSRHADLFGTREHKYEVLRSKGMPTFQWQPLQPSEPFYLLVPQNSDVRAEYEAAMRVPDIFNGNGDPAPGIVTTHDEFAISWTKADQIRKVETLLNTQTEAEARSIFRLCSQSQWNYKNAKTELSQTAWRKQLAPILYRPFDMRWTVLNPHVAVHRRERVMRHIVAGENLAVATTRGVEIGRGFEHVFVSNAIIQHHTVSLKEVNYLFPLYLYNPPIDWDTQLLGRGKDNRRANLSPQFVAQFGTKLKLKWVSDGRGDGKTTFGPEDVLAYIYALFHAPSCRSRYAEFLKIDFPRVPLTNDAAFCWQLVEQGRELIRLHLLDGVTAPDNPVPHGEIASGYPKYESGRVLINAGSGFDGVSEDVWNFHIGGYQVAHKWLKDRKGRTLSADDAAHYRKIIKALESTIAHMAAIDEIIAEHGGWPLPGSQEPVEVQVRDFFGVRGETPAAPRPVESKAEPKAKPEPKAKTTPKPPAPESSAHSISDYSRDDLIKALLRVCKGKKWHEREDVLHEAARALGFGRVGRNIRKAFGSAFNGAIRRGLLEYDGTMIRRAKS